MTSWILEKAPLVFLLFCFAICLWVLTFVHFGNIVANDKIRAFDAYDRVLFIAKFAVLFAVVVAALLGRFSLVWPLSMFLVAAFFSTHFFPTTVLSDRKLRLLLDENIYYSFPEKTLSYAIFAFVQILGLVFAKKRRKKEGENG